MTSEVATTSEGTHSHSFYAKDDSCITTTSTYYQKAHELEEFSSLFKRTHRPSQPLTIDVSLELEVLRNSLGKIIQQRRMDRRYSHDSTFSTEPHGSTTSNVSEDEDSCTLSPKVHNLLWDLDNCLAKIQQNEEEALTEPPSADAHSHVNETHSDNIAGVTSSVVANRASTLNPPGSIFAVKGFSKSETFNDKCSDISDDSTPPSSKYSVTVSEVYMIAILAGWVLKLSNTSFFSLKSWKRRFLVLTPTTLFRYKSSAPTAVADEYLELTSDTIACVTDKFAGKRWVLEITSPSKPSWYIQTESLDELKTWLNALKASVIRAKYCNNRLPSAGGFNVPLAKQDTAGVPPLHEGSRRDSTFTIPLARPRTLHALSTNSKSMSALPPQPPIPKYLPPLPPVAIGGVGTQRHRITRAPSSPAIMGSSMAKESRVSSFNRRLQSNHIDTTLPSSRRNSAVLPTLNEDD
ncbi:hypothetical protein K493DRAFT_312562 [Basidiobolus meristosporus CBS 931.73]|uniref:PH domain-containing protein n=1 Tax=Basidiobolus meristosporus CBS 931.73 TaxID=1314790 RepID=A0A1Y1YT53_9FUNG|nr:hypothetical protein K493DRAFT_312562 [Basidiobolus meristosporus CBS 931.73]|eukprot:ORY01156.1 hypothetical protein K493DRAFT_312562 [Basidiobolus meristosporus CBS 931.73]